MRRLKIISARPQCTGWLGQPLMRRSVLAGLASMGASPQAMAMFMGRWGGSPSSSPTIALTDITLGSTTFSNTGSTPITVSATNGTFTVPPGSLALSGSDAANFEISGTTLSPAGGSQPAATYNITITATLAGATNSPLPVPFTVTLTGAPPVQLWSVPVVDDTGSTRAAGTYFVRKLLVFQEGDIPAGTAPTLKVSGVTQPYSYGFRRYHADGSLWHASFLIRPTVDLTASSSFDLEAWSGGTWPAASARTWAEVEANGIQVNVTGAGANFGLAGTWSGYLIDDANNWRRYVTMDGAAGVEWHTFHDFAQSAGGAEHGQLVLEAFVSALTDASGTLGGISIVSRVIQPYYNYNTPTKDWRAFTAYSISYAGGGGATVNNSWPYVARDFTATATNLLTTTVAHGWNAAGGNQNIPCVLTTTGTLPTNSGSPINANQLWFMRTDSTTQLAIFPQSGCNSGRLVNLGIGSGSGTHTATPVMICTHYGTSWSANNRGRPIVFQGSGSITSPSFARAKHDTTYWRGAKLPALPWDTALSGTIAAQPAVTDWSPAWIGPLTQATGTTGERSDIGPMPDWAVRAWWLQNEASDRVIRAIGYMAGCDGFAIRDKTTGNLLNPTATAYTGLTSATTIRIAAGNAQYQGTTDNPPSNNTVWPMSNNDGSHKCQYSAMAYIMTGEPQFLYPLLEQAIGTALSYPTGTRNITVPFTASGVPAIWAVQPRTMAWDARDLMWAEILCPNPFPDGSQLPDMLTAMRVSFCRYQKEIFDEASGIFNVYSRTNGMWCPWSAAGGGTRPFVQTGFQYPYLHYPMLLAKVLGDSNADTWLQRSALWATAVAAMPAGLWAFYGGYNHNVIGLSNNAGTDVIDATEKFGPLALTGNGYGSLSWTSGNATMTMSAPPSNSSGWTPANGDIIIFPATTTPPGGFTVDTVYYVVNRSGSTNGLAATAGGAAITPSTTSSTNLFYVMPVSAPSATSAAYGNSSGSSTPACWRGVAAMASALGYAGGWGTLYTDVLTRTSLISDWNTNARYRMQNSY